MDNPLTALVMLTATTGGWFGDLSDTKKGIAALFGAVVLGFAIGTATIAQVGIPQRVEALELAMHSQGGVEDRVEFLESEHNEAKAERAYMLRAIQWQGCALEAQNDGENMRTTCGLRPEWSN